MGRTATLKLRLQGSIDLIDNDLFLPMFRNRQKNYEELYNLSVDLARKKDKPSHYFAKMWSVKSLKKTINMLQKLVNKAKSAVANTFWRDKKAKDDTRIAKERADHAEELAILADLRAAAFGFRTPKQAAANKAKKRRK